MEFKMEFRRLMRMFFLLLLFILLSLLASCGPVVYTASEPGPPPPAWFYPNRVEVVRYVYFPELRVYFDLYTRDYLYLDGGAWVRRNRLPPLYRDYDLQRYRYRRIPGYRNGDIAPYDRNQRRNSGRSNRDRKNN